MESLKIKIKSAPVNKERMALSIFFGYLAKEHKLPPFNEGKIEKTHDKFMTELSKLQDKLGKKIKRYEAAIKATEKHNRGLPDDRESDLLGDELDIIIDDQEELLKSFKEINEILENTL